MSKYTLTAQEIRGAISGLTPLNAQFKARIGDLAGKQAELASQWQGDANTAFNNAFNTDKSKWDSFATLMDQYIEALQNILTTYETAESTNVQIATTRT